MIARRIRRLAAVFQPFRLAPIDDRQNRRANGTCVSGAGRPPKAHTTFCTVDEDFTAYGLLDHRHTPEMEMLLGATVLFTPHLAPMNRGILSTIYVRLKNGTRLLALDAGGPIWNAPWFSRKNSRFSGKNRLNRVRLICCASVST